jgi:hypothetical protein
MKYNFIKLLYCIALNIYPFSSIVQQQFTTSFEAMICADNLRIRLKN